MSDSEAREQWEPGSTEESLGTPSVDSHLADASDYCRLLIDSMVEGLALHEIILDEHGTPCDYRFLEVNPAFEILTGLKGEDVVGHTVLEVLPGTELLWIERYGAVALTGVPARFEDYSSELGKHFGIVAYSPQPRWFVTVFSDITERKEREQEALKSQLLLKASLEGQKGTLLFSIDREYRYLFFNMAHADAMRRAYGQEVELGMCVLDCITNDSDREAAKENYDRAFKGESHSNIRAFGNDNPVYFESFFNPIVDDAGSVFGATGLARDITERMQVEQALLESWDALIGLTNQVPGVVYVYRLYPDGSSAFPFSSRGMNDIYEYSPEEVQADATPVFGRLHLDDYDYVAGSIQESARTLKPFHCEFRVILPRQGLRWRLSDALPQRMEDGGTEWYGIIQDVTERKQAEMELLRFNEDLEALVEERTEEAIRANEAKSEFLASMSHELRTPLNSIIGFSRILLNGMAGEVNQEQQRQLGMIQKSGTRLLALVNDILDLSKIEAKAVRVELSKTNINRICGDAVEQVRPEAEAKGVELLFTSCAKECSCRDLVMTDQDKLTQIVLNLLINAVKFTKVGSVKCEIDCAGEKTALIRVIDTGVGIERDALERIFMEFVQIPSTDEAKPKGTGLGLPISRKLASLLGGDLTVTSTPGSGSEFTLQLPLHFADDSHERP